MRQGLLRRLVMYLMLAGHVLAIFAAPLLIADFNEALNVSMTMLPVTAAIITFIVQFHQENFYGSKTDRKVVSRDAATLTLALAALLLAVIIAMLYLYYSGHIATIETLQRAVSLVDTAIIIYLVLLLRRLFERQTP